MARLAAPRTRPRRGSWLPFSIIVGAALVLVQNLRTRLLPAGWALDPAKGTPVAAEGQRQRQRPGDFRHRPRHGAILARFSGPAEAVIEASTEEDVDATVDVGYNLLFQTATDEFDNMTVQASKPFPAYAKGDFVIPSIGLFEMGERKFVGFLDCFGKMQKFTIDEGSVSATYRLMASGFYNESKAKGTIGAGLLFFETQPPRETPWYLGSISHMPPFAPNDNTYVNTIQVGGEMLSLTDSFTMLEVDPTSLRVKGTKAFRDDLEGLICYTGSAHPMRNPQTGGWVDFVGNAELFSDSTTIRLFELSDNEPDKRRSIADYTFDTAPYMHSFGVTENFAVLPRMPVMFAAREVAMKPMAAAFQQLDVSTEGSENAFHVVPLNGSQGFMRKLPKDMLLWYVHTVNSFENGTGVVIDLATSPVNPFASELTLEAARSKKMRDSGAALPKNIIKRFVLPWEEGSPITVQVLSDEAKQTEFPCINPRFRSKSHCFFWAIEWFADGESYASMAIVKYDICTGEKKRAWTRQNWYPSEATMVPSDREGAAEDEGVLLFTALDGASGKTYMMGVDAQNMETVSQAGPFPRIAFTTHGSFYPAAS